jgi:seryl-tRNA synthetase
MNIDPQDVGTYAVGGTAILTTVVWAFRKAWQQIVEGKSDTVAAGAINAKNEAEAILYQNLKDEISRMSHDILKIKQDYKDEKLELEARIDDLEAKIYRLSFRIGNIRKQALDAYSLLLNVPKDLICQEITEAISHIQNILEEE